MRELVRHITLLIAVAALRSHALTKKAARPNSLLNLLHHSRLPSAEVTSPSAEAAGATNISGQFMLRLLGQEETADEETFTLAVTVKKGLLGLGGPPRPGSVREALTAAMANPSLGQAWGGGNDSAPAATADGSGSGSGGMGKGSRRLTVQHLDHWVTVQHRDPVPGDTAANSSSNSSSSNDAAAQPEPGHPVSAALHPGNASAPESSTAPQQNSTAPRQSLSGAPQHRRKHGTACVVAKNNEFCLEGNIKYLTPYVKVLVSSDIGGNYAHSDIIPSACAEVGFSRFGKKNGCYKKRLAMWFHPGARGDAELGDNHYAQADQEASAEWVASHSTDEWEDMMQTSNPCNNSYPWDP